MDIEDIKTGDFVTIPLKRGFVRTKTKQLIVREALRHNPLETGLCSDCKLGWITELALQVTIPLKRGFVRTAYIITV